MASHDPEELYPKLEELGVTEVRRLLAQRKFGERKTPVVELWLQEKAEEEFESKKKLYSPLIYSIAIGHPAANSIAVGCS